jgi:hypothetical protein
MKDQVDKDGTFNFIDTEEVESADETIPDDDAFVDSLLIPKQKSYPQEFKREYK